MNEEQLDYKETDYIEWDEPFDSNLTLNVTCRMQIKDVIFYMKSRKDLKDRGFSYKDDQEALIDFMAVHWARLCE